jgi:hypothetical protein
VLHLVGVRWPVDASAGRLASAVPLAQTPRLLSAGGGVGEHPQVDVLVELLELIGAGVRDGLPERVGERSGVSSRFAVAAVR